MRTMPLSIGTIHFVGIGGIGMSGIAEILHNLGYSVQGSDIADNYNVERLRKKGIAIHVGHAAENLGDARVVVVSSAVRADNPELVAARARLVPVVRRAEMLAELMRLKYAIAIGGTHGKTTTTSMIATLLEAAALDPTVINGGIINAYGTNTRMGASQWMVVEADESDGTFAKLPSIASIITNIDPEHLDYYGSFDKLKEAFVAYAHNLPFYGFVVACIDHPVVEELLPRFQRKTITYGFSEKADIRAVNVQTTPDGLVFDVLFDSGLTGSPREIKNVKLPMFGPHNVLNALTSFAVGHELGLPADKIVAALAQFSGVSRRFTTTGIVNDITIIDDYGHHPAEIAATLKAGRDAVSGKGSGRIIAVMQPHRYTRLQSLFEGFCHCFGEADEVIIANVYAAGEDPITGVDRDALVSGIRKSGKDKVYALENAQALAPLVHKIAKPGDFVICLGAGSITQWAHMLPKELEELAGTALKQVHGA